MLKKVSLLMVLALVLLAGVAADAACICGTTCPWDRSECIHIGRGECSQVLFNRCQNGACGAYHEDHHHCVYACKWESFKCPHWLRGWVYCEVMTQYDEWCFI